MEAGVFTSQLVAQTIRCDPPCELCSVIAEQVEQPLIRAELEPPKKKKKGQPAPPEKKFSVLLAHSSPLCGNTTKFSKFIHKKKPYLKKKINQCAVHLTDTQNHLHNVFA